MSVYMWDSLEDFLKHNLMSDSLTQEVKLTLTSVMCELTAPVDVLCPSLCPYISLHFYIHVGLHTQYIVETLKEGGVLR